MNNWEVCSIVCDNYWLPNNLQCISYPLPVRYARYDITGMDNMNEMQRDIVFSEIATISE